MFHEIPILKSQLRTDIPLNHAMIAIDEERIGQYCTQRRAQQAMRLEETRTNRKHGVILTTCYRDLIPRICWVTYLYAGKSDAMKRALGA